MDDDLERRITTTLRTAQKVFVACIIGTVALFAMAVYETGKKKTGVTFVPGIPIAVVGLGLGIVFLLVSFGAKRFLFRSAQRRAEGQNDPTSVLLPGYLNANTYAAGFCQGSGMAICFFAMITGSVGVPWLAAGVISLFGFAIHFPTREKLDAFLGRGMSAPQKQ